MGPSAATVSRSSIVNTPTGDVRAAGFTVKLGCRRHRRRDVDRGRRLVGPRDRRRHGLLRAREHRLDVRAAHPVPRARHPDRSGLSGTFASGIPRTLAVAGSGGVPSGATAITGNLVAVNPGSNGYLSIGSSVSSTPATSSLNVLRGDTRAASVTVKLDGSGRLGVVWKGSAGARTDVILDVTGYFAGTGGATYYPLDAARVLDSRIPNGLSGPVRDQGRPDTPGDRPRDGAGERRRGDRWGDRRPAHGRRLADDRSIGHARTPGRRRSTCRRATSGPTASRPGPARAAACRSCSRAHRGRRRT